MKNGFQNFLLLGYTLLMSCGTPTVQTSKMANADLSTYGTYAWLPGEAGARSDKYDMNSLHAAIVSGVNEQLSEKGYTLDRTDPDLLVFVHTIFDDEKIAAGEPVYTSYNYYTPGMSIAPHYEPYYYNDYRSVTKIIGYDIAQVQYTEGTIVVDLIDRNTKTVVWRGKAENHIAPGNIRKDVEDHIDKIFDKFPS